MRSILGIALLTTGLVIGAYAYYPNTVERHIDLAAVTRVIAPVASADATTPAYQRLSGTSVHPYNGAASTTRDDRTFSPGHRLIAAAPDRNSTAERSMTGHREVAQAAAPGGETASQPVGKWRTAVTPAIARQVGNNAMKSSVPADGSARYALIRDLQRELKRVGCYWGKIDGSWGGASKSATTNFVRAVNSTLPTTEPDYFILALARAQHGNVCGTTNSTTGVIAHANPRLLGTNINRQLAANKNDTITAPHPRRATSPGQPATQDNADIVTAAIPTRAQPSPPLPQRATRSYKRRAEPLPGRMAVGGPPPSDVPATQTAPATETSALPATYYQPDAANRRAARPALAGPPKRARRATAKTKSKVRVARVKPKKKKSRRVYRKRHKNPLSNLLRQGVY